MTRPHKLMTIFAIGAALAVAGCGSDDPQDANEPTGDFEVEVTTADFPIDQRIAKTSDLVIGVENTGSEAIPELAITIETNDGLAGDSFAIRSDQPNLADPNRSVWILENKYPREVNTPPPPGLSGGTRAQTNTFGFGPLDVGESREIVWRVTPVMDGSYTLSYEVAAGLDGKAKAVTSTGEPVSGDFEVEITDEPPAARVNNKGEVVTKDK